MFINIFAMALKVNPSTNTYGVISVTTLVFRPIWLVDMYYQIHHFYTEQYIPYSLACDLFSSKLETHKSYTRNKTILQYMLFVYRLVMCIYWHACIYLLATIRTATFRATVCSNRWWEPIKCRVEWAFLIGSRQRVLQTVA